MIKKIVSLFVVISFLFGYPVATSFAVTSSATQKQAVSASKPPVKKAVTKKPIVKKKKVVKKEKLITAPSLFTIDNAPHSPKPVAKKKTTTTKKKSS